jgi:hypothetical protein
VLYDLVKGPNEIHNQYLNPEYEEIIAELKQMLQKSLMEADTDEDFHAIK